MLRAFIADARKLLVLLGTFCAFALFAACSPEKPENTQKTESIQESEKSHATEKVAKEYLHALAEGRHDEAIKFFALGDTMRVVEMELERIEKMERDLLEKNKKMGLPDEMNEKLGELMIPEEMTLKKTLLLALNNAQRTNDPKSLDPVVKSLAENTIKKQAALIKENGDLESISTTYKTVLSKSTPSVDVDASLEYKNGKTGTIQITLINELGEWKIISG